MKVKLSPSLLSKLLNDDGTKDIFAVASGSYNKVEQQWTTNEHEGKALHNALLNFKHYLLGREFNLFTDNRNLTYLQSNKADKIHRWACDISQFTFLLYHIPGQMNWEADFLSRIEEDIHSTPITVSILDDPPDHGGV